MAKEMARGDGQGQNGQGFGQRVSELLPVKRTVKKHKVFATSNSNVAGCFLRWSALGSPRCDSGHYSGRSKQL